MFARTPASSANLGPGFDTLAVALALYVDVEVTLSDGFAIETSGCGAGYADDERHLGARVAASVLGHMNFSLRVNSSIPLSRGLGSSAALAVAAAAAAGARNPLELVARLEGHAENAAASVMGGLVVASVGAGDQVFARRLALDDAWCFVVVVPEEELATADARRALPREVPLRDAVLNLNAMGLLIAGLAHHEDFVASSMDDHLHQPYRRELLAYSESLMAFLRESGAAASCWSGAGSAMLALVTKETAHVVAAASTGYLFDHSIPGEVLVLDVDHAGLVTR